MGDRIAILDTTLRDGLQGRSMALESRLEIFAGLDRAGVDIIEAATFSPKAEDPEPVRRAIAAIERAVVCVLAYPDAGAIDRAGEAIKNRHQSRIHVFNSVLAGKEDSASILDAIADTVGRARRQIDDVQWGALDASRADRDFVCRAVECAISAGAGTINIADTMGLMLPDEFGALVRHIADHAANVEKAAIAVHCHNDLGLATANSLAGIAAGAVQVECTLNGLGPRGGNTSLQEMATVLSRRADAISRQVDVDLDAVLRLGELLSGLVGPSA